MVEDDKTDSESSSDVDVSLSLDSDSLWLLLPMLSMLAKRLASASCASSRQEMEKQEFQRWQLELADLVKEAGLPVVEHMRLVRCPESMLLAALGSSRASTVHKHVREWRKVRIYWLASSGMAWPEHAGMVLDYLHERYLEPCSRTVPQAILSSLSFLEKAGRIVAGERLPRCLSCATQSTS
eukprot:s679_g32.t1